MSKAESFIATSDFATLKNDDSETVSITMPASVVIPAGGSYILNQDISVGLASSEQRIRVRSSLLGSQYYNGLLIVNRIATTAFGDALYGVYTMVARISPTVVRCSVVVPNGNIDPITTHNQAETFTFVVNTFLSPAG